MKKVILLGSLCLALGMASCKTYCPAYSSTETEQPAQKTAATTAQTDADVLNS